MGSKSPHHDEQRRQDAPSSNGSINGGGESRGEHLSRDGDGCVGGDGNGGTGDDDDDDQSAVTAAPVNLFEASSSPKKKKNKKRKAKKPKKPKANVLQQSTPPRVPLDDLFPSRIFPVGEMMEYMTSTITTWRASACEEQRGVQAALLEDVDFLNNYRTAAEVHRHTRHWVQEVAKPGYSLTDLATGIENSVRAFLNNAGLETGQSLQSGLGFPTGLALNHCVAHYTPNSGHKEIVLQQADVLKVDFGVHINGWIVDSAFTVSFDPTYDDLLAAVKDATNTGIRTAGIDVRISDVSAAIQEAMESYEVTIRGKTYPVKPVRSLSAHDIKQYRIHGGKSIPSVKNNDQTKKEAGEVFAIETFGTTGRGYLREGDTVYGYGIPYDAPLRRAKLPLASANRIYKTIKDNFGTIVFSRRSLEHLGCERYLAGLNSLVSNGYLDEYMPLMDVTGSYSAQFEHTILLRESAKEVISRGDDY